MIVLKKRRVLVAEFGVSKLDADLAFMLVIVVNKEVAKTITSFLTILDTTLNDAFFCYNYNT